MARSLSWHWGALGPPCARLAPSRNCSLCSRWSRSASTRRRSSSAALASPGGAEANSVPGCLGRADVAISDLGPSPGLEDNSGFMEGAGGGGGATSCFPSPGRPRSASNALRYASSCKLAVDGEEAMTSLGGEDIMTGLEDGAASRPRRQVPTTTAYCGWMGTNVPQ